MENLKTTWDFVEKYYHKYQSSNEISENDDLQKIVDGEIDGQAEIMYNKELEEQRIFFGGTLDENQLHEETIKIFQARKNESDAYIFEQAIEGYLETLKK